MSVAEFPSQPAQGFERTPPQDITAEQCVLGGMLLSKDAIADVVEVLREHDFYRPAHAMVYDAALDLYGRGEPADPVTVAAELTRRGELARIGGAPYLHTLISSVPTAANAGYYARIVRERAILRRLVEAGTRIVQLGYTGEGDGVDDVVDAAQAEVYAVTDRRTSEDYQPLSQIMQGALDEIEAIGSRGGEMVGVPTGFGDLDSLTNGLHPGQMIIIAARPALGKALALDTALPTPTGWTTMGEVRVGDQLLGADGRPTRVLAMSDVMHDRRCYEVEFSDGSVIVADGQHQWLTETRASRRSAHQAKTGYNRYRNQRTFAAVRTTEQIAATLRCDTADARLNHSVRHTRPLKLEERVLPLPPYVLGVWLGDGHSAGARFTTADPEIVAHLEAEGLRVSAHGGMLYGLHFPRPTPVSARPCIVCGALFRPRTSQVRTCGRVCGGRARFFSAPVPPPTCPDCGSPSSGLRQCRRCRNERGTVPAVLRVLGVFAGKHIPGEYVRASESQRRALLAGLLDTDGTVAPTGVVQFTSTNRRLAQDVHELALSLGYRGNLTRKVVEGRSVERCTAYTLTFSTDDEVFRLERKRLAHKERGKRSFQRRDTRFITDVRRVGSVPVRCVQVDSADQLYLAGRSFIPTHNSTLALDLVRSASVKHGLPSVMFSLEMGRNEITMRLLSAEARVALHHMRSGTMTDDDWTRLARRMSEVAEAPIFIDDSPNMTMMEIRAKCRRLKQRHDLRLVVVDYLQLMTSGKRVESRQQEVSEFSRSLKLLAKEIDVPVVAVAQLNRGPEQRTDKKPLLSDLRESGCVTADTRILRADNGAETTIGELVTSGARDIPVWSLDESLRMVPRTMTHAFPSGVKEVFELRLRSGRVVKASANHPLLSYDGWTALENLRPGSRVAVPREVPVPAAAGEWCEDEVVLLAHLLGDGSFVKNRPIRYASVDEANLNAVGEAARRRFGITAVRDEYPAARVTTLRLPAPYHLTHRKRNPIAAWLDGLGLFGLRSHEKFVPVGVFSLSSEQIALFLRHLWATDGSIRWDPIAGQARIYYASTSRQLVDDISQLLLRVGIVCRIKAVHKSGYRVGYHLYVYGVDNQRRFLDRVGCHGARYEHVVRTRDALRAVAPNTNLDTVPREVWDDVRAALTLQKMTHRQFAASMGTKFCGSTLWKHAPSRSRLGRIAALLHSQEFDLLATSDVFWDEVASVESLGKQPVYDATVLGTHNFVGNGISLHNSLEQDSDMVVLLHREDAYERESPRAGEADLIVAKHRNGPTATITVAFQGHYSRFVDMAPG